MGAEVLETGKVNVFRPDAQELLEIKRGKYSQTEILKMAASLEERLNEAYQSTTLPDKPNESKIEAWLIDVHRRSLDDPRFNP